VLADNGSTIGKRLADVGGKLSTGLRTVRGLAAFGALGKRISGLGTTRKLTDFVGFVLLRFGELHSRRDGTRASLGRLGRSVGLSTIVDIHLESDKFANDPAKH
jgi:hypothetical protein